MDVIADRIPDARALMLMLPGAGDHAADFLRHGFVAGVREAGLPVDVLAVEAHSDLYLDKTVIRRLHSEVVAPELAARPKPFWITGISLGGMGSCLYTKAHPEVVSGLILLAPFLAVRGTIAQVTRAGGLAAWQPEAAALADEEVALLDWLKRREPGARPAMWLGYGTNDRYAPASELLAARLPPSRVLTCPGGHDWPTWQVLWPRLLQAAAGAMIGAMAGATAGATAGTTAGATAGTTTTQTMREQAS